MTSLLIVSLKLLLFLITLILIPMVKAMPENYLWKKTNTILAKANWGEEDRRQLSKMTMEFEMTNHITLGHSNLKSSPMCFSRVHKYS